MANIVETVAGDRRISLLNEEIVRQMAFGQLWQRIIISLRVSIQGGATLTSPQELIIGVCSGLNGAYKPSSVTASYGMVFPGNAQNLTYNAGPPAYYSTGANGCRYVTKVGSSVTYTNVTIANQTAYFATGTNTPNLVGIVFTRTGLNTITITSANLTLTVAAAQAGHTLNQLYRYGDSYIMTPATLFPNISATTPSGQASLVTTEVMDSAFIYWSNATTAVEVSDWMITRMQ